MKRTNGAGWVLLEVMVAVALLAILAGTLAGGMIGVARQGAAVENAAERLEDVDPQHGAAWQWATDSMTPSWDPGPTLRLELLGDATASAHVFGLWVGGWLMTEATTDPTGATILGPNLWTDRAGEELVIRVRSNDGIWGPPWRTVVPEVTGIVPGQSVDLSADACSGEIVVHPAGAVNPEVRLVPTGLLAVPGPSGLPFFASALPAGVVGIKVDGLVQTWISESHRSVDVYF